MGLITTELNALLDGRTYNAISLHSGDPGTNGANELTSSPYARATGLTFGAASNGRRTCSTQPTIQVKGGDTVCWVGVWNSTTFVGKYDVPDEEFTNDGTYKVTGPGGSGNPYVELT
jgi:hypothetical protein